jgi:hypothetical protein
MSPPTNYLRVPARSHRTPGRRRVPVWDGGPHHRPLQPRPHQGAGHPVPAARLPGRAAARRPPRQIPARDPGPRPLPAPTAGAPARPGGSPAIPHHAIPGSPIRHAADTMWMLQPRSQVCMAGTSTPYARRPGRPGYPAGYEPGAAPADERRPGRRRLARSHAATTTPRRQLATYFPATTWCTNSSPKLAHHETLRQHRSTDIARYAEAAPHPVSGR